MISRNKVKFLVSLQKKKVRDEERLYIIEGDKLVKEFLNSGRKITSLFAKPEFISGIAEESVNKIDEIVPVSYEELKKISCLNTPHNAIAVIKMEKEEIQPARVLKYLSLALDFIQDPGNLGTIIRAAAWFGIKNIVCSEDCVDVYNPKVVQATMGALLNVQVYYYDLREFLKAAGERGIPVYATVLDGESIYKHPLGSNGVILLGNESKGISDDLMPYVTTKLVIPKFTSHTRGIESLNAGMAASIVLSEFARRGH